MRMNTFKISFSIYTQFSHTHFCNPSKKSNGINGRLFNIYLYTTLCICRSTAGRSSESLSYLYKYSSHKNLIAPDHYIPIYIFVIKCVIELNIFPPRGVSHPL